MWNSKTDGQKRLLEKIVTEIRSFRWVFFFLMGILTLLAFCWSNYAQEKAGQVSVRYGKEQCTGKQLDQIRNQNQTIDQNQEEEEQSIFSITAWKQTENVEISKEDLGRNVPVKLVEMWGDVEQIFPECLSAGSPLLKEDQAGCMLSKQAAYELFGGTDVVGKTVAYGKRQLTVRGLLEVEENILVMQVSDTPFTYLEIAGTPGGSMEPARTFLIQAGVELEEGAVIEVDTFRGILHFMQVFPAGILMLFVFYDMNFLMKKWKKWVILTRIVFGAAGLFLLFVGFQYIWCFSEDFLPSKWSDFAFFGNLIQSQIDHYKKYLDIPEIYRDRELFQCLKRVAVCQGFSMFCLIFGRFAKVKH